MNDQGGCNTEKNHGRYWEIEPEIFFFNPYIAGKPSNPMELIVKKIDDNACQNYQDADANN